MTHQIRRNHQNKARFSPTFTFGDSPDPTSVNIPGVISPTPNTPPGGNAPSATPGAGGIGGILTSILGIPSPIFQHSETPPVTPIIGGQRSTTTTIVVVATPSASSSTTLSSTSSGLTSLSSSSSSSISTSVVVVQATPTPSPVVASTADRVPVANTPASVTFAPVPTVSSAAASASPSSSSMGTGSIVGIAAAGVAGVAVLGIAGVWLFKKYISHKDEPIEEPTFTRHSWMRQSVAIPDDSVGGAGYGSGAGSAGIGAAAGIGAGIGMGAASMGSQQGPNARPRPPTMIERHQANVAAMRTQSPGPNAAYGNNNNYNMDPNAGYGMGMGYGASTGGYDPYNNTPDMRSMSPGAYTQQNYGADPQPYYNPIASAPPIHPSASPAPSVGSGPTYFSRANTQPSMHLPEGSFSMANHPYADAEPNASYATMERSSPYQTQTNGYDHASPFADPAPRLSPAPAPASRIPAPISLARAVAHERDSSSPPLSPARIAQVVTVPDADMHAGRETPVQFGFSEATKTGGAVTSTKAKRSSVQSKKSVAGRPETIYDEEDAYGGI